MTGKNFANGLLWDITAVNATAALKIANVVVGKCGNNHSVIVLQGFGNLGNGAKPSLPPLPVQFVTEVLLTPESKSRTVATCHK